MVSLAGCVETYLAEQGITNCRLIVTAAESIDLSADMSDGDTAWVALGRAEPLLMLEEGQSTRCNAGYRYTLMVGHVTCYPVEEDPLTDQVMLEVTDRQMTAMLALRQAITCCDWIGTPKTAVFDVVDWTPIFEGGVVGGQWQVVLDA